MANFSTYKKLELPTSIERYNIQVVNKNNIVIDSELNKLDIKNKSQDELLATKEALNSEVTRATIQEDIISKSLSNEITRSKKSENELYNNLNSEINRATTAEENLRVNLNSHNTSTSAHNDIRDLISNITTRLNTLADSDDTTLDQLSEIVAYIKNNKNLIEGITTSKTNVSDIIDNLTSTDIDKPLSAKQGKVLKELIDSISFEFETEPIDFLTEYNFQSNIN